MNSEQKKIMLIYFIEKQRKKHSESIVRDFKQNRSFFVIFYFNKIKFKSYFFP